MMTAHRVEIIDLVSMGLTNDVKTLIKAGCDVNEQSYTGSCAVMAAVQRNDSVILAILIEAGARVDVTDGLGCSALLYAEKCGFTEVARLLETTLAGYERLRPK